MPKLTQIELKRHLTYCAISGNFYRKISLNSKVKIGDIAGGENPKGYTKIRINSKKYSAHRLAFLYMEGEFPSEQVDHINHITFDNSWRNLRKVSRTENYQNKSKYKNNNSNCVGVYWKHKNKRWVAEISINGERINLGCFVKFSEAVDVRKNAEVLYGFHKNHGK